MAATFGGVGKSSAPSTTNAGPPPDPLTGARRRRVYGYKLLLYISYALSGRCFPQNEPLPPQTVNNVRADVLHHLFEKTTTHSSLDYPRLHALVELDAKELFNILARVFDDPTIDFEGEKKDASRPSSRYDTARKAGLSKCPSRLSMVMALAEVIFGPGGDVKQTSAFSSVEHGHFFMFEARLLSGGSIDPQEYADARAVAMGKKGGSVGSMMNSLMNFLALGPASLLARSTSGTPAASQAEGFDKAGREAMLVRLLQTLKKDYYNLDALLQSVKQVQMHRAAVILYKENDDFSQAVASYLADADHEFRLNAFTYIRVETDKLFDEDTADSTMIARRKVIEDAVLTHAGPLMETDGYAFVVLIVGQFPNLNNKVIQRFLAMGKSGTKLEFQYLKYLLKGSGNKNDVGEEADVVKDLLDRSKLRLADDPAVQERFVRLLCEFEPEGVFSFLESNDNYKVDECLKLCKDFKITDAEAYLLERTGDVTGALTLILQSLEQKLKILRPALRGYNMTAVASNGDVAPSSTSRMPMQVESIIDSVKEGREAKQTLEVALVMCQRNSQRNRDDQAEKLWFTLLDKLLRIQNAVKRSLATTKTAGSSARITAAGVRGGTGSGAQTALQVALNELIRIVLERMASCVSLKSILFKITSEHGKAEFGDFRSTIFGMLDTYNYEQNIFQTANGLISVDLYEQVTTLKRALSRAYAPPSDICAYCKVSLVKPPFGMAHSGASGSEKWNLNTSMVMVVSRQAFHETCGKAWQQQAVETTTQTTTEKPTKPGGRPGALQRTMSIDRMGGGGSERSLSVASANEASFHDDESSKLQKKQPSTRRYLTRLKNARKNARRPVSLHIVLESLIREDNGRNKYLKSSRAVFSLRPDPEQANKIKKRIGTRKPGSLPVTPAQKGSIKN